MADTYIAPAEVGILVSNLNKAAAGLEAAAEGDIHVARRKLQHETRKLLYSLEEPNSEVFPRTYQVNLSFQNTPKVESISILTCGFRSMSVRRSKFSQILGYGRNSTGEIHSLYMKL